MGSMNLAFVLGMDIVSGASLPAYRCVRQRGEADTGVAAPAGNIRIYTTHSPIREEDPVKAAAALALLFILSAGAQNTNPYITPADRESGAKIFRSHCA